jgi:hypothetical protein
MRRANVVIDVANPGSGECRQPSAASIEGHGNAPFCGRPKRTPWG